MVEPLEVGSFDEEVGSISSSGHTGSTRREVEAQLKFTCRSDVGEHTVRKIKRDLEALIEKYRDR